MEVFELSVSILETLLSPPDSPSYSEKLQCHAAFWLPGLFLSVLSVPAVF